MKNHFVWAAVLICHLLCFSGCDDETPASEEQARVEVSLQEDLYLNDEGDTQTFTVNTNKAWAIQGADKLKWLSVEPSVGGAGESTITIKALVNETYSPREAQLTLRCGTEEKVLKFIQVQNNALLLSASVFDMTSDGGAFEVVVKANINFTVEIPEDSKSWISREETQLSTRALQSHVLTFKVGEYTSTGKNREGRIVIKSTDDNKSQTIIVNQALLLNELPNLIVNEAGTFAETLASVTNKPDTVTRLNLIGKIDSLDLVYIKKQYGKTLVSLRLNRTEMPVSEESGRVRFPSNALNNSASLSEFTFPRNIEVIGASALNGNTLLRNQLEIPESVIALEMRALQNTKFRGALKLPEGLQFIASSVFNGCEFLSGNLVIPAGVKDLGSSAFQDCSNLSGKLTIPATLETIGASAFSGCKGFSDELVLPATLQSVGSGAFQDCIGLTSVKFEWQPTELPMRLFSGCSALSGVFKIPATVTTIKSDVFSDCSMITSFDLPADLTSIGQSAFSNCVGLTGTLTLPSKLTELGTDAYKGCTGITSIVFPSGMTAVGGFGGCLGLEEVTLADGITELQRYAFNGCTNLKKVNFPATLKTVGISAFDGCTALEGSLELPAGVETIGSKAFNGCTALTGVILQKGLKTIEGNAFYGCKALESLKLPEGLETIGSYAFKSTVVREVVFPDGMESVGGFTDCLELTSITIPASVKKVDNYGFQRCSKLAEVIFKNPASVTEIGNGAFQDIAVTSFIYPETVEKIGTYALSGNNVAFVKFPSGMKDYPDYGLNGCKAVTSFTIPEDIQSLGKNFFSGCNLLEEMVIPASITKLPDGLFYGCSSLKKVVFKGSITAMGSQCFQRCESMEEFDVPEGITKIENNTFLDATSMKRLTLPESLLTIGNLAFQRMTSLTELVIPKNVTSIGNTAFSGTSGLTRLTVLAEVPPVVSATTFNNVSADLVVYVPAASVDAYKASWTKVTIEPIK